MPSASVIKIPISCSIAASSRNCLSRFNSGCFPAIHNALSATERLCASRILVFLWRMLRAFVVSDLILIFVMDIWGLIWCGKKDFRVMHWSVRDIRERVCLCKVLLTSSSCSSSEYGSGFAGRTGYLLCRQVFLKDASGQGKERGEGVKEYFTLWGRWDNPF